MKLYTHDPKKNKKVLCGEIVGNALFRWVKPQHFMRINQAYGIQEIAFQEIVLKGIEIIILKEEGTNKNWEAPTSTWLQHGSVQDYGHGKQRFLSMKYQKARKNAVDAYQEREAERAKIMAEQSEEKLEQNKLF